MRLLKSIWRMTWNTCIRLRYSDEDLIFCEACGHAHHFDKMNYSEDCYFCNRCWQAIIDEISSCDHETEPHVNVMGEDCLICNKCSGVFPLPEQQAAA